MNRYALPIAAFIVLVAFLGFSLNEDPNILPSPFIDKPAPEFQLPKLKDPSAVVGSADLMGSVSLLNVWATWCSGCRVEHPFLMQLAESGDVPIYGLNWKDRRNAAIDWLGLYGDPYVATGYDAEGRVGLDWGVFGAPETFLMDAEGTVLHKHLGPLTPGIWKEDFLPKIAAARGETE